MLPLSFSNYFVDLTKIHKHNTRQKSAGGYYHHTFGSEFGRKRLHVNFSPSLSLRLILF